MAISSPACNVSKTINTSLMFLTLLTMFFVFPEVWAELVQTAGPKKMRVYSDIAAKLLVDGDPDIRGLSDLTTVNEISIYGM